MKRHYWSVGMPGEAELCLTLPAALSRAPLAAFGMEMAPSEGLRPLRNGLSERRTPPGRLSVREEPRTSRA